MNELRDFFQADTTKSSWNFSSQMKIDSGLIRNSGGCFNCSVDLSTVIPNSSLKADVTGAVGLQGDRDLKDKYHRSIRAKITLRDIKELLHCKCWLLLHGETQ